MQPQPPIPPPAVLVSLSSVLEWHPMVRFPQPAELLARPALTGIGVLVLLLLATGYAVRGCSRRRGAAVVLHDRVAAGPRQSRRQRARYTPVQQCRRGKVSEEADEVMRPRRKRKKGRRALLQEESEV